MMGKFVTTEPLSIFVRAPLDSPAAVQKYWADYRAARTTSKEDPRMLTKSTTDVAWAAVSALGWDLVQRKKAATFEDAVAQLKQQSHPSYLTYLSSLGSGSAPEGVTTTEGVGKRAEAEALAKRAAVEQEVQKRVGRLTRAGLTQDAAMRQMSKDDPAFYAEVRKASYSRGPLPPVEPDVRVVPTGPVYAQIRKMALELRSHDPWGQYAGKSAAELEEEVFKSDPALYQAYRREVAGR
jgi:hypothetical protein